MTPACRLSSFVLSVLILACAVGARPQAAAPAASADDPKAADLVRDAARLEQEHNWAAARQKLDEAKAINPQQAFLWSSYAYVALMDNKAGGKPDEPIQDLQRELANHPDEQNVSMMLAQMQSQQHKPQDAIATLQKLVAVNPANDQASGMLVSLLLGEKDYPGAEKALHGVLAAHPDSAQAQLLLSTALLREDKKSEASALLKGIAEKSQDPMLLNDAAYALGDEGLDLPLAEQTSRHSLALLEAQSTPGVPDPKPLLRAEIVVSVWDTLGWILFREGKVAEAEPLLRAAWSNSLGAESGYHFGMILEKEGQPVKAMAVYQVAQFGDRGPNAETVDSNIAERLAALRKAGTPSQVADGKAALLAQRTFKVPGTNTLTGTAVVEIDLSAQGASNAIIVKDDPTQKSLTPVESSLRRIDFKASIPPGSHAIVTRRGVLTCHAGTPCQFVLFSTRAALAN